MLQRNSDDHLDMLTTEPVCFWFSLWVAFSWAVLYLTFGAIPLVFTTRHGFDTQQNGAVFAGKLFPDLVIYHQPRGLPILKLFLSEPSYQQS